MTDARDGATHDEEERPLDGRLLALAREYNAPGETPRDAMWEAIARRRGETSNVVPLRPRRWGRLLGLAAAAAALVTAGALMERARRGSVHVAPVTPVAASGAGPRDTAPSAALRYATSEHLAQVEALLVRSSGPDAPGLGAPRAARDQEVARWAQDLLGTTRLLLDSRAADDVRVRPLLEDLELALARIVQRQAAGEDAREIIDDVIERQGVLDRLRAAVPAGPTPPAIGG